MKTEQLNKQLQGVSAKIEALKATKADNPKAFSDKQKNELEALKKAARKLNKKIAWETNKGEATTTGQAMDIERAKSNYGNLSNFNRLGLAVVKTRVKNSKFETLVKDYLTEVKAAFRSCKYIQGINANDVAKFAKEENTYKPHSTLGAIKLITNRMLKANSAKFKAASQSAKDAK